MSWLELGAAILAEVIATFALEASNDLSRPVPTAIVGVGYAIAFYLLSRTVWVIALSIAYAIWAGSASCSSP